MALDLIVYNFYFNLFHLLLYWLFWYWNPNVEDKVNKVVVVVNNPFMTDTRKPAIWKNVYRTSMHLLLLIKHFLSNHICQILPAGIGVAMKWSYFFFWNSFERADSDKYFSPVAVLLYLNVVLNYQSEGFIETFVAKQQKNRDKKYSLWLTDQIGRSAREALHAKKDKARMTDV